MKNPPALSRSGRAGIVLAGLAILAGVGVWALPKPPPTHVRVAAIQFHSTMGDVEANRRGLTRLIREAAARGAKIVVLPEAAVSGYADIDRDVFWTSTSPAPPGFLAATSVAEPVDGASVHLFATLAKSCRIYLTVPFVEGAKGKFYNSIVLLGPDGAVRIHYRKQHLWTVADPSWVTPGDLGTPVIDTEYGRLGVMVCYDVNYLLPEFKEKAADLVLHCVAWFGPWFDVRFNKRVRESGAALVLANWSFPEPREWRGGGGTRILGADGEPVARIERDHGDGVVIADLPLRPKGR